MSGSLNINNTTKGDLYIRVNNGTHGWRVRANATSRGIYDDKIESFIIYQNASDTTNELQINAVPIKILTALTASGTTTFNGEVALNNNTTLKTGKYLYFGSSTYYIDGSGNANLNTLNVVNTTTLKSTLAVDGATTLNSTLAVTGETTLTGGVTAGSYISATGNITSSASISAPTITATTTLTSNGTAIVKSPHLTEALTVTGGATFGETVTAKTASIGTGGITVTGTTTAYHINPAKNNSYTLGTESLEWAHVYATNFTGTLNGNASSATALTSNAGSSNTPIYFSEGKPVAVTLKDTANNLINNLDVGSSTPVDADYYISQYVNGGTTTTTYHRRPMSALYDYIKAKTDLVYLKLTGGTLTGAITFKNTTTTPVSGQLLPCVYISYQNSSGNYYNSKIIDMVGTGGTDTYNSSVRFGSEDGSTWITAGESGMVMPSVLGTANTESIFLTADSDTIFYNGCANDGSAYTNTMKISSSLLTAYVNILCSGSDASDKNIQVKNSNGSIGLLTSTNRGVYDYTNKKWVIYTNGSSTYIINWANIGASTSPVYFNANGVPTACSGRTVPGIKSASSLTHLGWGTNNNYVPDISCLSYWSGAYDSNNNSNLRYCAKGAFGSIVTKNTGDYLPISGGTLSSSTAQIQRAGSSVQWIKGRTNAMIRINSYSGYNAIYSMKTTDGDWSCGVYSDNTLYWTYCTDTNYNANNNTSTAQMKITSAGTLTATKVYGAVWNDYAEFRESNEQIEPGRVVIENGDDTLSLSRDRLQPGPNIVSDTYGFAIGETSKAKTPIAVSGRVLAYPYESIDTFSAGDPVCSGPNGTVSKMTREEVMMYPDRIIGTVSSIPTYKTWGTDNVNVNGRIWIKIK